MKVLVVDDSILMRNILKELFRDAGVTVLGEGSDGRSAVELNRSLRPDLIVMDINMPNMGGLEATTAIMGECPTAIVIFSNEIDAKISFQAIQAGAVEVVAKPDIDQFNDAAYTGKLLKTLSAAAGIFGEGRLRAACAPGEALSPPADKARSLRFAGPRRVEAVVIGASTGGPVAVRDLLRGLPADFPAGIALVQHIEERFDKGYAEWLDGECGLRVRLARASDCFTPGEVIVAPSGSHLVCAERRLLLADTPPVGNQKPSVDRLFETAALCFKDRLAAVLLTGMGADGAEGCVKVKALGGLTLVQDEASSFIYGMPKAAVERGGAVRVLGLPQIPAALLEAVSYHG
ncbi:MAG TPA: chemotaxis-specific protein-glutamate methyltransferase CheB [Rectinemataceae bacterium]|nr:chemotaxis-specific protein-glutamate methyltransferase CheB [Rectinemataceae bacterium]